MAAEVKGSFIGIDYGSKPSRTVSLGLSEHMKLAQKIDADRVTLEREAERTLALLKDFKKQINNCERCSHG